MPGFDFFTKNFRKITCCTSAPFRARHMPYPSGYVFPLPFGATAFASCSFLIPLGNSGCLAASLLNAGTFRPITGLLRSTQFEMRCGLGSSLYSRARCPHIHVVNHECQLPNTVVLVASDSPDVTKLKRSSLYVNPFTLPLASFWDVTTY